MDFMSLLCSDYNLDWLPESEAEIPYSTNHSFPFAPVTPDHAKQFENPPRSEMRNFSGDESSSQDKDKQENMLTSILSDAAHNGCNQLLQDIVDSSFAAISPPLTDFQDIVDSSSAAISPPLTDFQDIVDSSSAGISPPLTEKNITELVDNQGIDLNKTPQQKTPKRRKHRPKVIVEGKPKRTPKAQTPSKTNSENPSGKRKYVRKNLGTTPTQEHKYATDAATIPTADSSSKSCRRKLDFVDLENGKNGEAQGNAINVQAENNQADGTGFYLNYDSQATRLSTGSDISTEKATLEKIQNPYSGEKQQQVQSMFNRTHSINQMLDGSAQFPKRCFPAAQPTAIRNNTINDIARRLHNNASFIQRAGSNIRNHPQCLLGEFDRMFKQARPSVNLETTALPSRQSALQNVGGDFVDNNGNGGCSPYLDAIQQASTSFKNQEGVRGESTRKFSQVNGPTINLETTVLRSRQSTPQMVGRDIVDYNRNGGRRSSCLNAIPQASPSIKDQEFLQGELNRRFIQANGQTINLETKVLPSWQSNPQKVGRDIADYNGNGGCGGPYLNATQQASASFKDQEYLQGEANRRFVQEKGPAINLEPTVQPSQRSTLQKVGRDMADYNGNVGCRVPYLNATKQASPSLYGHDRNDPISSSRCLETHDGNTLHDFHQEVFKDDSRVTEELPQWLLSTSQRNNVRQEACPSFKDQGAKFNYNGMYRDHNIVDQRSISRRSETHDRNRVLNNFPPEMVKEDSRKTATGELPSRQCSLPEIERNGSAVAAYNGTRGVKRPNPNATQRAAISFECWKDLDLSTYKDQRTIDQSSSLGYPETRDRNSFPKDYQRTAVENHFRKVATAGKTTVSPSTWVSRSNGRTSNYRFEGDVTKKLKSGSSNSIQNGQTAFVHDSVVEQRPNGSTQVQDISSTLIGKSNLLPPALPRVRSTSGYKQGTETCPSTTSLALKNMASTSLNLPYTDKVHQQENKGTIRGNPQIPKKPRGRPRKPQQTVVTVDDITSQLQVLRISSKSEKTHTEEQNALVLYEGFGKLVPYEDPSKKRKPRPKVDLDPDTNRVWKLLMGKEGSEDTEAPDKDKEKWWENERNVFRGRAESFIARMHLVQGDRRFSRWKGSVVDSVIGVFLTQNVSDHLSSSAFMSLAARFPLRVTTTDKECYQSEASILPNEQKNQIPDLNGTMECFEEILRQPVYNRPHPSFHEPRTEDRNSTTGHVVMAEKNVASSSHNSYDSFFLQLNGESQSGVGSNSEDSTSLGRSHVISSPQILSNVQSSFQVFHDPRTDSLCFDDPSTGCHEHQQGILRLNNNLADSTSSHIRASGDHMRQGMDSLGLFRDESIYSLPSTNYGVQRENGIGFLGKGHYEQRMAEAFRQENGVPVTQGRFHLLDQSPLGTNRPPTRPTKLVFTGQTGSSHGVSCVTECSVQAGLSTSEKERAPPAAEKLKSMQTKMVEVINTKEQVISSAATTGARTDLPNARKGKAAEDDKTKSFDWDILRKNVLAEGKGKVSTSKDAMDSMDYETMRCANVNEISNAIKERGMNNMLAERMKDFLNRLVTDHGSIDLEWLRDVPPDKAKDYLLSIRGLGLKSVECVRLLTLHHLAFPVDTNVGRIAVRLGWVPLQPLPESLQLHLLELYPMLETIQKYLWPRLCKLDQPTLYELHYQMITFGKVFCTKSKPNCNACPMRGECRHFASAFASARLALPGPEEKGIVSSNAPATHYKNPAAVINPIPLLPANNQEHKEMGSIRNCEPIVEEPATPEPETEELSLSDIEDAFYEDPDEIPTIKLNVEEFAMNLHNYMQENMELQDGDMSKALVALNPEAPSIPTQKLKNVSRLRTEHQVYELPDCHPLLEGLDKREPDDPTPYLLAIWTPGETPNSIQPPESGCEFQETGNLCDRSTCFSCNSVRESNSQIVRGTILVPCRTAMRGSFPLNGTYFQVNEVFADHESSLRPISVPRELIWNLPRRTVYFGTSVSTIFKGLSTEGIQFCFWKGFVCVRGFDQKSRAPRPLKARLHFPASAKLPKQRQ